jgi:protein-L-isoaspartate(D-aspartate) O-methyltransferase
MDSRAVQRRMVERLYADGIRHQRLLEAFSAIPRHWFVDSALVNQAYEDTSLPIGLGQTISKPSVIGSMIELLCVRPGLTPETVHPLGHCLDIGTGCGYQAALLSVLSRRVVSVERLRDLHLKARANLDRLRRDMPHWQDVRLVYGDGMLGHPPNAPYDTIIAAAGGAAVPQPWIEQLAPGGRLVAPMEDPRTGHQVLTIIDRLPNGQLQQAVAGQVLFVPLKSGTT